LGIKVCKFGGTSLADATQLRKVASIVRADPTRRYVVVSAPGKRSADDRKITDLLYLCHAEARQSIPFDDVFNLISERYLQIVADLSLATDLRPHLEMIKNRIADTSPHAATDATDTPAAAYAASRGEYLSALIISELLDYSFVDAAELIRFDESGALDRSVTARTIATRLAAMDRAVIPGFYGSTHGGEIRTFTRGGSDISGALVASAVGAEVYENWTDVSGLLMADPRIVDHPRVIDVLTYRELRELTYMGATVLHEEAIFPVRDRDIPVNVRNTNDPDAPGSQIVSEASPITHLGTISGIAGRKDFTVITVEKALMNSEIGFGRRLLGILESHGVSYEHTPSGIDTMSVVVADRELDGKIEQIVDAIRCVCQPDAIEVQPHMALIATVGRGMAHTPGIAARLFVTLGDSGINIRMIDQGSSEMNIIVGVEAADFEKAVRAIYETFVTEQSDGAT